MKRSYDTKDLVIVAGRKDESRLLKKAILISKKKYDKNGKPYHAVSEEMGILLGISGSIQRSIPPRFIRKRDHVNNVKRILGL